MRRFPRPRGRIWKGGGKGSGKALSPASRYRTVIRPGQRRRYTHLAMKSGHKNGRSSSVKPSGKRGYRSTQADSKVGTYRTVKADANGSGYRSAKTGRFIASNAPRIKSVKQRSTTVGEATKRVKTAVTVDLPRSRRSK